MSAQADFEVDAIQQVRDEATGARNDDAAHLGGKSPEATEPCGSKAGKPHQSTTLPGPYSVTCAIATETCRKSSPNNAKIAKHSPAPRIMDQAAWSGRAH